MTITLTVPEDSDGVRLDRFLASVVADRSRSQIQRLIKDESVRVAGRIGKSNQPVKAGQTVVLDYGEAADAPSGATPPAAKTACASVPEKATGSDVQLVSTVIRARCS